jgi:hypothetical protein
MNLDRETAVTMAPDAEVALLAAEAEEILNAAQELEGTLHLSGVRDDYRIRIERGIALARLALQGVNDDHQRTRIRKSLIVAHAARAEDARYGAGQLSRSAQRAPTREDCEDGWLKVRSIVENARTSSLEARRHADAVGDYRSQQLAARAERAAAAAQRTLDERNQAYTFFTDPGFSFGEGWYLAAASLLVGLPIQVKAGTRQEVQARRFLDDAGLSGALVPYRSRPANPKHLTDLIARSFRADPGAAQELLRAAFLGSEARPSRLVEWVAQRVGHDPNKKVLLWVRISDHDAHRNTDFEELLQISRLVLNAGLTPVFFGDAIDPAMQIERAIDLSLCWKEPIFQGADMRRAQLQLFEELRQRHGLVGQIGVTTAGMDGPALLGLPTAYLTASPNVRLGKWVGAVPGYQELVRQPGYFKTLGAVLEDWITQPVQGDSRGDLPPTTNLP